MAIIHPYLGRKKKRKPTEKERALRAEWERILNSHCKPLDLGAQAKGLKIKGVAKPVKVYKRENPVIPSLPMNGVATRPIHDPAAGEKEALKGRVGQVYPKGGPQYMTDSDLKDSKDGLLRRRS